MKDDQIAIKMLTRFKQIKKNTSKSMVDVEMMLGLLDVVRKYDLQPPNQAIATDVCECDDAICVEEVVAFCQHCGLPMERS